RGAAPPLPRARARGPDQEGGAQRLRDRHQVGARCTRARAGGPAGLALVGATRSREAPAPTLSARKLRVGVFADARRQPRWMVDAFAKVAASDFAEVVLIAAGSG